MKSDMAIEAAQLGVALVGHDKALDAALRAHVTMCVDFFKLVQAVYEAAKAEGEAPVLPLNSDVLEIIGNMNGSLAVIAAIKTLEQENSASAATVNMEACGPLN